jgi:hypothetical protein
MWSKIAFAVANRPVSSSYSTLMMIPHKAAMTTSFPFVQIAGIIASA